MSPRVVQSVGESNWGGKNEGLEPIVVFKSSIATVHPVSMNRLDKITKILIIGVDCAQLIDNTS